LDLKEADMSTATTVDEAPNTTSPEGKQDAPPKAKVSRKYLFFVVLAVLLVAGLCYWLSALHYESTDDAQVDGHFAQLSTRITGTVTYVTPLVENDRYVTAGMLLLELDPRDYQADLEHAKATLETKEAAANAAKLQVPITQASAFSQLHLAEAAREQAIESVVAAEADLTAAQARVQQDEAVAGRAERDRVRYAALVEKREISRSFYDARMTDAAATAQTLASDSAAVKAAQQRIAEAKSLVAEREAQVASARTAPQQYSDAVAHESSAQGELDQARADVHTAELNLSYTEIYAPVSGVVGHKTVDLPPDPARPVASDSGAAGRHLDHRELQGNSVAAHAPGAACHDTRGYLRPRLQGHRRGHGRSLGATLQSFSAGERERQLRKDRAALSDPHPYRQGRGSKA
jgi:membrane fusion protein (multidrug efflux system)